MAKTNLKAIPAKPKRFSITQEQLEKFYQLERGLRGIVHLICPDEHRQTVNASDVRALLLPFADALMNLYCEFVDADELSYLDKPREGAR